MRIFVDQRGWRARFWWLAAFVAGLVGVAYLALAVVSLIGSSSFPGLPWPQQGDLTDARAGVPFPPPVQAAPSAQFVRGRDTQPPNAPALAVVAPPVIATAHPSLPSPSSAAGVAAVPHETSGQAGTALPSAANPTGAVVGLPGRPSSPASTTGGTLAPRRTTTTTAPGKTTAPGQAVRGSTAAGKA